MTQHQHGAYPGEHTGDHDGDDEETSTTHDRAGRPGRMRTVLAAVLAVLLILAVALGAWGWSQWRSAEERLDERADATRVAERFTVLFNTYSAEDVDGYAAELDDLLSTSARTAFEKQIEDITSLIEQTGLESEGEVLASAVASLEDDSATVLVVADAAADSKAGGVDRHFRWEVSLVKVDGEWLVDDFSAVS